MNKHNVNIRNSNRNDTHEPQNQTNNLNQNINEPTLNSSLADIRSFMVRIETKVDDVRDKLETQMLEFKDNVHEQFEDV